MFSWVYLLFCIIFDFWKTALDFGDNSGKDGRGEGGGGASKSRRHVRLDAHGAALREPRSQKFLVPHRLFGARPQARSFPGLSILDQPSSFLVPAGAATLQPERRPRCLKSAQQWPLLSEKVLSSMPRTPECEAVQKNRVKRGKGGGS